MQIRTCLWWFNYACVWQKIFINLNHFIQAVIVIFFPSDVGFERSTQGSVCVPASGYSNAIPTDCSSNDNYTMSSGYVEYICLYRVTDVAAHMYNIP